MKATLEFDLEDSTDRNSHKRCINATNAYIVFFDLLNHFRTIRKYEQEYSKEQLEAVAKVEEYFIEQLQSYGINMDDLE